MDATMMVAAADAVSEDDSVEEDWRCYPLTVHAVVVVVLEMNRFR